MHCKCEAWSPSGGGCTKVISTEIKMAIRVTLNVLCTKLYWFHYCSAIYWLKLWIYRNLHWPAQTAVGNEPVFDEQNPVLSPGVNTHTCHGRFKKIYQNSYLVSKHSQKRWSLWKYKKFWATGVKWHLPWKPFGVFHPRVVTRLPAPQAPITAKALNIIITT